MARYRNPRRLAASAISFRYADRPLRSYGMLIPHEILQLHQGRSRPSFAASNSPRFSRNLGNPGQADCGIDRFFRLTGDADLPRNSPYSFSLSPRC